MHMRAKTLIVFAALTILLLLGLYERRAYCDAAGSLTVNGDEGFITERQSFLCGWFSRE